MSFSITLCVIGPETWLRSHVSLCEQAQVLEPFICLGNRPKAPVSATSRHSWSSLIHFGSTETLSWPLFSPGFRPSDAMMLAAKTPNPWRLFAPVFSKLIRPLYRFLFVTVVRWRMTISSWPSLGGAQQFVNPLDRILVIPR